MSSLIPYALSVVGAICYGAATVLEQIGAKNEKHLKTINPLHLITLIKQGSYFLGLVLDLIGWVFFLFAVRSLPLFLVQSFIALSIVVSALLDRYWLKHAVKKSEKVAIVFVVIGVTLLSVAAKPSSAIGTSNLFKLILIISPLVIAIIAAIFVRLKTTRVNSTMIALLAGLSFGGTSIVTRILNFSQLDKQINQMLLAISLVIFGVLALVLLSIALQREKVNRVNSVVLASEVIGPSLIGIIFLGDTVRNGLWLVMIAGLVLVLAGALATSSESRK
jgi:drug/metabolite transporter (DMT)-like permease